MDTITVKDIEFITQIGTTEKERATPQTLYIDITITHTRSNFSDDISTTFDYVPVAKHIYALQHQTRNLIETLAREILDLCLTDARVSSATVTVRKPEALKNGLPSVTLQTKR